MVAIGFYKLLRNVGRALTLVGCVAGLAPLSQLSQRPGMGSSDPEFVIQQEVLQFFSRTLDQS